MYSGGFDSHVLLRTAVEIKGRPGVLSLSAFSPLLASFYSQRISDVTGELGVVSSIARTDPLSDRRFKVNDDLRCYHCKKQMYMSVLALAGEAGCTVVADGTTRSDMEEDRPGLAAAAEAGIRHPFAEAGMGEEEVTRLGEFLGVRRKLSPSDSCLATRIPSLEEISLEKLQMIERMEAPLRPCARGRFRVVLVPGGFLAQYSMIDEALVEGKLEELESMAAGYNRSIRFQRLEK